MNLSAKDSATNSRVSRAGQIGRQAGVAMAVAAATVFAGTAQAVPRGHALGGAYYHDAQRAEAVAAAIPSLMSDTEKQTALNLINAARAKPRSCGTTAYPAARPVVWNTLLEQAAQRHSNDMATRNFFSHTGSDGSRPSQRITAAGYVWSTMGENIAAGYSTVQSVVDAWLKSPGHCANIMNGRFKEMGMARAVNTSSRYGVYWTLEMAAPR